MIINTGWLGPPQPPSGAAGAMTARADLTEKIVRIRIERDLTWAGLAALAGGLSKEYVTAALMGQMPLPRPAAEAIGARPRRLRDQAVAAALSRLAADAGAGRSADLPFLRAGLGLRHGLQGPDPRGIRRWHHERHRLPHGPATRAQQCRRPREHRHERQVPALQAIPRRIPARHAPEAWRGGPAGPAATAPRGTSRRHPRAPCRAGCWRAGVAARRPPPPPCRGGPPR